MKQNLLFLTILLFAVTTATLWYVKDPVTPSTPPAQSSSGSGEAQVGGDFTLTDQHGNTVKDADFRGRVMLVFFGFTRCPDICPVTAKTLSDVMAMLGDQADQVAPLFISIDPRHDTPEVMKDFFSNFDSRIVALSGNKEQVQQVASAYKAYYAKSETAGEDLINHSGYIYLMDRQGKYSMHFSYDASPQTLVDAVRPYLE